MTTTAKRVMAATASTAISVPATVAVTLIVLHCLGIEQFAHETVLQVLLASVAISAAGVLISFVLTPIVGLVVLHHIRLRGPLSRRHACIVGGSVGVIPFLITNTAPALLEGRESSGSFFLAAWFLPLLSAVVGVVVGITFWYIVIKGTEENEPPAA